MERKSKGRQKIRMAKIEKENNLQVTFSKRRAGLFKKASELAILCGAEVAVLVFSPGGKVYSFGHPNVESITDKFITGNPPAPGVADQFLEAHRNANIRQLNSQLAQIQNMLEEERKRGETLDRMAQADRAKHWWRAPIGELSLEQLEEMKGAMEKLRVNVRRQADQLMIEAAEGNPNLPYGMTPLSQSIMGPGAAQPFDARDFGFSGSQMLPQGTSHGSGSGSF